MKTIISVNGKFHAFELASELHKRKQLYRIITTYPYSHVENYSIPRSKVVSLVYLEILKRFIDFLPLSSHAKAFLNYLEKILFDINSCFYLSNKATHFIGWASNVRFSIFIANKLGLTTILERGSTHILHQKALLLNEYRKLHLNPEVPINQVVKRELKEYSSADYIFVPSQFVCDTFTKNSIKTEKIRVIQYGIQDFFYVDHVYNDSDSLKILFVGRLSIRKGGLYLLRALNELFRLDNKLIQFDHFGVVESSLLPYLPSTKTNCHFHGTSVQSKLPKVYQSSSLFLFPSLEEGLALVLLQAAAAGLPIAATKSSGALELTAKGASIKLIEEKSSQSIINMVLYLRNNPEILHHMSISSKLAANQFTQTAYGNRISSTLSFLS